MIKTSFNKFTNPDLMIKTIVNEATDLNGKVHEDFRCVICLDLVYQPLICISCGNAIYCKLCIKYKYEIKCQCGSKLKAKPIWPILRN